MYGAAQEQGAAMLAALFVILGGILAMGRQRLPHASKITVDEMWIAGLSPEVMETIVQADQARGGNSWQ